MDFALFERLLYHADSVHRIILHSNGRASWNEIKATSHEKLEVMLKESVDIETLICDEENKQLHKNIKSQLSWKEIENTELNLLKKLLKESVEIRYYLPTGLTWSMLIKLPDACRKLLFQESRTIKTFLENANLKIDELVNLNYDTLSWLVKHWEIVTNILSESNFSFSEIINLSSDHKYFIVANNNYKFVCNNNFNSLKESIDNCLRPPSEKQHININKHKYGYKIIFQDSVLSEEEAEKKIQLFLVRCEEQIKRLSKEFDLYLGAVDNSHLTH